MVRARLEGVFPTYKTLKDGSRRTYWYHRATGARLHGNPGSAEFVADYATAEKLIRDRHAGTLNSLIRYYASSVEFEEKLAPSTQMEYRRMLMKAELEFGNMPIAALDDPRVKRDFLEWREKTARASGHREADNRLSAISAMLTWAADTGKITANHLKGFKRLYHVDRSEIIWLPEHIAAFMKVAPIEMQRALILGLHTGQREGDILRLSWSAYDGLRIVLRQGKARRHGKLAPLVEIPCTAALRRMLDAMDRVSPLILTTKTGQSFKKRHFARLWNEAMMKAGLHPRAAWLGRASRFALPRSSGNRRYAALGICMHTATDRDHYRSLAQKRTPNFGTVPGANTRPCRAGDLQFRELTTNKVCKPTANQHNGHTERKAKTRCRSMT